MGTEGREEGRVAPAPALLPSLDHKFVVHPGYPQPAVEHKVSHPICTTTFEEECESQTTEICQKCYSEVCVDYEATDCATEEEVCETTIEITAVTDCFEYLDKECHTEEEEVC